MIDLHSHTEPKKGLINIYPDQPLPKTHFSCGFHPLFLDNSAEQWNAFIERSKHPLCLAIGECGLDKNSNTPLSEQIEILTAQIKQAILVKKPVIIHLVKAIDEFIQLTKPYQTSTSFIVHGFNKNVMLMNQLLNNGFYFSLGAATLNRQSNAYNCLLKIPLNRLFLETDNDQVTIEEIYEHASIALEISQQTLINQININFEQLFHERL